MALIPMRLDALLQSPDGVKYLKLPKVTCSPDILAVTHQSKVELPEALASPASRTLRSCRHCHGGPDVYRCLLRNTGDVQSCARLKAAADVCRGPQRLVSGSAEF